MADISKIKTPGGDEYNLKDASSRNEIKKIQSDIVANKYSGFYINFENINTKKIGKVIDRSTGVLATSAKWLIIGGIRTANFKALKFNSYPSHKYRIYGYSQVITDTTDNTVMRAAYLGYIDDTVFNGNYVVLDPTWVMIIIGIARTDGVNVTETTDWPVRGQINAYKTVEDALNALESRIAALENSSN